jgi:hypothetical protein
MEYLKLLEHLKTHFLFRITYSMEISNIDKCVEFEENLNVEISSTKHLLEKLFSVCNSAFI